MPPRPRKSLYRIVIFGSSKINQGWRKLAAGSLGNLRLSRGGATLTPTPCSRTSFCELLKSIEFACPKLFLYRIICGRLVESCCFELLWSALTATESTTIARPQSFSLLNHCENTEYLGSLAGRASEFAPDGPVLKCVEPKPSHRSLMGRVAHSLMKPK
jgi:hypothetical protein